MSGTHFPERMGNMRGLMFTLGAAVIAMGAGYAQSALLPNMDYEYSGDALPQVSTPAWSLPLQTGSASQSVSGGILTVTGTTGTDTLVNRLGGGAGLEWDPDATGSTLELRLKVDSLAPESNRAGGIGIRTGTNIWLFTFGPSILEEVVTGQNASVVTDDAFHTYRMTIAGTAGPLNVYVDGNTTPLASFTGGTNSETLIDFGDNLDAEGGVVQWDYIQWTNDGVFAPVAVPEPAALSLLALGVLAIRRSRRS